MDTLRQSLQYDQNTHTLDSSWAIYIAITGFTIALITRFFTGRNTASQHGDKSQPSPPPTVPYWFPIIGHIPNMAINADSFLRNLRKAFTDGIFTLNFLGSRHNVIYTPGLATAMLNQKTSNADSEGVGKRLMVLNFGFPSGESDKYDAAVGELHAAYKYVSSDPWLGDMVRDTARKTRENVNNLVTFMESPVDQMPWEKVSNVKLVNRPVDGKQVVEASLLGIIRDFCAWTANPSLMGSDFLENFPEYFDDVWTFDRGFLLLATGLPRWIPIPILTRAHIARKKNLDRLNVFHTMMERHWNGESTSSKWSSLDDVSALLKVRMEIYRRHNLSIRARASVEHALLWAANANSNALVFWIICRIYEDKALLAMIREEIAPHVEVTQEETGLPISDPPRITKLDVDRLCDSCPLLKSCYVECLRVDTGSWSFKTIKQDFVLQSRDKEAQAWLLKKGDYAHVAHDLHNTDPNYFESPTVWKADRHVKYDEKGRGIADMGSIRPYGGGSSMCKGRAFAFKEVMIFSAAIVAMWDIEMAGGGEWRMPSHRKATGVFGTADDTRVWIKRRELAVFR